MQIKRPLLNHERTSPSSNDDTGKARANTSILCIRHVFKCRRKGKTMKKFAALVVVAVLMLAVSMPALAGMDNAPYGISSGTITNQYVMPGTKLTRGGSKWTYHTDNNYTCNQTWYGFSGVDGSTLVGSQHSNVGGNSYRVTVDKKPTSQYIQLRIHATNGTITSISGAYYGEY